MGALSVLRLVLMTYQEFYSKYKSIKPCYKPNKLKFPENLLPNNEQGAEEFNDILEYIHSLVDSGELDGRNTMPRTRSGGIKVTPFADHQNTYSITVTTSMIEVLLCYKDYYRFYFRRAWRKEKDEMSGCRSFHLFKNTLKKFNINIDDYKVSKEEGLMYKSMMPSPIIDMDESIKDKVLENAHHIDIHSAHMAGMAEANPDLRAPIEYLYNNRKIHQEYKSVLTHTWGFCQSRYINYSLSHLSLDGISSTNRKVRDITKRLIESGRKPFLWNTDGVWYTGDIYHGDGEGKSLGQWSNDHINCTVRVKSKGTYEYIEDGKYTPVPRGPREYDKVKPREEWVWGDIYRSGKIPTFKWNHIEEKLYKEYIDDEDFSNQ